MQSGDAAFRAEMLRSGNARWARAAAIPRSDLDSDYSTITAVPPPHEFLKRPRNYQLSVAAHIFFVTTMWDFILLERFGRQAHASSVLVGISVSALLRACGRFLASYCVVSLCWGGGFDHPGTMCSSLLLGEQQGSTTPRTKIGTTFRITDDSSSRIRNREALLPFDAFHAFSAKRRKV